MKTFNNSPVRLGRIRQQVCLRYAYALFHQQEKGFLYGRSGTGMKKKTEILDAAAINRALTRMSHEILEKNKGGENLVLIGIKTRGVPLAKIIQEKNKTD